MHVRMFVLRVSQSDDVNVIYITSLLEFNHEEIPVPCFRSRGGKLLLYTLLHRLGCPALSLRERTGPGLVSWARADFLAGENWKLELEQKGQNGSFYGDREQMGPGLRSWVRANFFAGEKWKLELKQKGRNGSFYGDRVSHLGPEQPTMVSGVKWGTSLLELSAMGNVTTLLVESRTGIDREQVIPYLTSFHLNLQRELKEWT